MVVIRFIMMCQKIVERKDKQTFLLKYKKRFLKIIILELNLRRVET